MHATSFAELGLRPEILRAITESGYTTPTPIQAQAIPEILAGHDIMGGAQTGTGKTAGFGLPILQKLLPYANTSPSPARHHVRALIIAPTRELAIQVEEQIKEYGKHTNLRSTCVFGGVDIRQQLAIVRAGVEILVATPGRLLDHVEQKSVNLGQVEILVLDEADRMLDMGFIPDIKRIMSLLPKKRQNLLFSATFSNEIKRLADELLNAPRLIEVARRNTAAETVSQTAYKLSQDAKRPLLVHLVKSRAVWQVLCFVRTKHGARGSSRRTASRLRRSTATRRRRRAWKRCPSSRKASCRCWSRPTSRHAASTSTACRSSSTMSCRTYRRTTSTGSAARAAPARPVKRFRSWHRKRKNT